MNWKSRNSRFVGIQFKTLMTVLPIIILTGVNDFTALARQAAVAVREIGLQLNGMVTAIKEVAQIPQEIAGSMESIVAMTEEQDASMGDIRHAATMLAKMAEDLESNIKFFKL
ncbi:hypothetical protein [Desulfosporosinus sp. SB140]|uniref:hypothetical protein n=1 Tax=Desulfosporosinus paludis TaxID=3115649 RepID=UPI00388D0954